MYAWVADKAGNISAAFTPQTITLDRTPPVVTFVAPTSVPTRSVTFTTLSATDSGSGVVKYLVVEGAGAVTAAAFPSVKPTSITLSNKEGVHTLYAYALDAAGNISAPVTQQVVFGEFSVACDQLARVAVNASGVFAVAGLQSVYVPVSQASYDHTKVSAYTAAGAPLWVVDEAPPDPFSFTAPSVGIDGSGNVAAAWLAPSATVGEIDARRYSSAGVAGSLFKVNTTALAGGGSGPNTTALAMNDGGQFVVVWDSYGADGDGWGVYAQRYAVSGVVGSEFRVNSVTIGDQHFPEVGMRSDGSFVICFQNGPDGNPKVDCVAYGSDGAVTKAELTVVSNSNGNLAVSTSGFVVAWTDVIGQGIQMQRFHTDGTIDGAVMFGSGGDVSGTGHGSQTWPSVGMAPSLRPTYFGNS